MGGVGAPNELVTFRVHDAAIDFVERSVWRTRNYDASDPLSALRISQADVGQDRREKSILSAILEDSKNKIYKIGPAGDRPGEVWLGSSGVSNFRRYIATGLSTTDPRYYTNVYVVCISTRSQCKRYFSIILMYCCTAHLPNH